MKTLLTVHNSNPGKGRKILENILLPPFKVFFFAASLFMRPWLVRAGRKRNAKLYQDVLNNMKWTISNLHPDISLVEDNQAMGRFARVILRCQDYTIQITREYYYGGDDLGVAIALSCHPDKYFGIGVVAKVIDSEKYAVEKKEPWMLLRTLNDLDSFIRSYDTVFKDWLSAERCENTSRIIEGYIWQEWHTPGQPKA